MYPTSDYNPETEGYEQNAHQHLTDVLGASTKPWLAVLKPGELTIMGDDNANTIIVSKGNGNKWSVSIGGVTTTLDASTPGLNSLNPFDAALSKIYIHGKGGSDTITVSVAAQSNVWGGLGNDTITGGAGADWFYGEAGNDKLYGNKGIDHLYGGADNDRLDGGFDGKTDVLRGESGADTFVVHRSKVFELNDAGKPVFVEWLDEIENMDFVVGTDLKVFIKHS
jgi:Ca2+-binding RTX toxin-like protein